MKRKQRKSYNYHHLKPRSRGGCSLDSNMLFIKMKKHNALHRMFGNATPKQIEKFLANFESDFKLLFGDVSFEEALEIWKRLLRMKGYGN